MTVAGPAQTFSGQPKFPTTWFAGAKLEHGNFAPEILESAPSEAPKAGE
jgi:hypothetical protein